MEAQSRNLSGFKFSVAPMMEWTDRHCRYFHRLLTRRALLYTEMLTTGAVLRGDRARLLRFDPSEQYLFVNTPRATEIVPPGGGNSLHSLRIGPDGRLTELASSPVPVPVALGTQPLGLAVAPR